MTIANEDYLRQQLEWVKYRTEALDEIEDKLKEMKELAVFARDSELTPVEAREINAKLHELRREVTELDGQSQVFWLDCQ
jgi:flagellin-like hook-associated protein FlgL